jgi:hypothetical protein
MANLKISELPQATAIQGNEEMAVIQGGATKRTTVNNTKNYIVPTSLTVSAGQTINLADVGYQSVDMIRLTWSGANGSMVLNLPDATQNVNRVLRFISNGGFETATRVELTPVLSQTLDGSTNSYTINKVYEGIQVWSDGIEWFIIQKKA